MTGAFRMPPGRDGARWRACVQWALENLYPRCWICERDIDMALDRQRHPMAFTVDHEVPLVMGGDPYDHDNLRPAHRSCNSRKGVGRVPQVPKSSRVWG